MIDLYKIGVSPMGIPVGLSWVQIISIMHLVEEHNVVRFIELGLDHGGVGTILACKSMIDFEFDYVGVDLYMESVDRHYYKTVNNGFDNIFIVGDCYGDAETVERITNIIKAIDDGCVCLFCDNGLKREEIQRYYPVLKSGDLLIVHDYGTEVLDEHLECLKADYTELDCEWYRKKINMPVFVRN